MEKISQCTETGCMVYTPNRIPMLPVSEQLKAHQWQDILPPNVLTNDLHLKCQIYFCLYCVGSSEDPMFFVLFRAFFKRLA